MKCAWHAALGAVFLWTSLASAQSAPLCCPPCPLAPDRAGKDAIWISADYLLWWIKPTPLGLPLVSTGPATDPVPGAIDQPNTQILLGNEDVSFSPRSGFRLNGGIWLDPDQRFGVDAGFFFLGNASRQFGYQSNSSGDPLLGHPFINAITGNENLYFFSGPADILNTPLLGLTSVMIESRLSGYDVNLAMNLVDQENLRLRGLVGYRGLILKESLTVEDIFSAATPGGGLVLFQGTPIEPPGRLTLRDSFVAHSRFYGGQLGARLDWSSNGWIVGLLAKVALGATEQIAFVDGTTVAGSLTAGPRTAVGGTFAQVSNIGRHFRREFAVVPEVGLNLGYVVADCLRLQVGYSFLYWSSVARPGELLDRQINRNLVPSDISFGTPGGPARPGLTFRDSDFWAHGLNFGAELRF